MTVLRLYFENDEPMDVKREHLVDLRPGNDCIEVNVNHAGRLGGKCKNNMTLVPKKVEMVEREEDSNVDLHCP